MKIFLALLMLASSNLYAGNVCDMHLQHDVKSLLKCNIENQETLVDNIQKKVDENPTQVSNIYANNSILILGYSIESMKQILESLNKKTISQEKARTLIFSVSDQMQKNSEKAYVSSKKITDGVYDANLKALNSAAQNSQIQSPVIINSYQQSSKPADVDITCTNKYEMNGQVSSTRCR